MPSILIVDVDAFFRQLLRTVLSDAGYEVIEARSISEGEAMLSHYPDFVIVDYRMPGMDEVAWINRLRGYGNTVPIEFCSGSRCDQQKLSLIRNIFNVSLLGQKPIKPAKRPAQIEKLPTLKTAELSGVSVAPEYEESAPEADRIFCDGPEPTVVENVQEDCVQQAGNRAETAKEELILRLSVQGQRAAGPALVVRPSTRG